MLFRSVRWLIESIKAVKELYPYKDNIINLIKEAATVMYKDRTVIFSSIPDISFVDKENINS